MAIGNWMMAAMILASAPAARSQEAEPSADPSAAPAQAPGPAPDMVDRDYFNRVADCELLVSLTVSLIPYSQARTFPPQMDSAVAWYASVRTRQEDAEGVVFAFRRQLVPRIKNLAAQQAAGAALDLLRAGTRDIRGPNGRNERTYWRNQAAQQERDFLAAARAASAAATRYCVPADGTPAGPETDALLQLLAP